MDLTPKTTPGAGRDIDLRVPLFVLTGPHLGPRLVVRGPEDLMRTLADTFWNRTELATIRGSLVLRGKGQDPAFDLPDETLALNGGHGAAKSFDRILARMNRLGMTPVETSVAA